jgi:hypothetical protein
MSERRYLRVVTASHRPCTAAEAAAAVRAMLERGTGLPPTTHVTLEQAAAALEAQATRDAKCDGAAPATEAAPSKKRRKAEPTAAAAAEAGAEPRGEKKEKRRKKDGEKKAKP